MFSYSVTDDHFLASKGHTFLGAALDNKGREVHVFMRAPRAENLSTVSTKKAIPDLLDALETLIGHVGHYASFPKAHSDAYRDQANASAALKQARNDRTVASLQTDLAKLTQLLTAFGVGFNASAQSDSNMEGTTISCNAGAEKVEGNGGFTAEFYFDSAGKFKNMGIWE